jgi:hypothetical protein
MSRPHGTKKPFLEDPDLCSIGAVDFLESIGISNFAALGFVAAQSFGKRVELDDKTLKKQSGRLKSSWTIASFEFPSTTARGKISTLRKKAERNIDTASINHRTTVATAHLIAIIAHRNLNLSRGMLSMLAQMNADDAMLQNYIFLLLGTISPVRPPEGVLDVPAVVLKSDDRRAAKNAKNAKRMRQVRAAKGATPRADSLSQKKPWEKLRMSRRAWYIKGKPV